MDLTASCAMPTTATSMRSRRAGERVRASVEHFLRRAGFSGERPRSGRVRRTWANRLARNAARLYTTEERQPARSAGAPEQGRKTFMTNLARRSLLLRSIGIAVAGTLARPYIANAAATTAEVWWAQGFVPEEDSAIKKVVADYEKASGNTIDLTITPFCAEASEDRRCRAERHRPRCVPQQPGRNHRALRLGRQADRRER